MSSGLALVGACYGDPDDPGTLSGVAKHLFDALERRYGLTGRVDYSLSAGQRVLVAARSVRPSRAAWRERYHLNALSYDLRSRNLRREAARAGGDLLVQVFGVVEPSGRPYVIYADQTWLMTGEGWPAWLPSQASERAAWVERERRMFQGARHVFTMARPAAESLARDYGVDRVTPVGGGLNFERLPEPRPQPDEPLVLFVGRDPLRKGLDTLLQAFRRVRERIPATRLRIIGTTVDEEPGLDVLGVAERPTVEEAYREATVFCMPSRYEPYGLAFLEAMAYGVPCIGTRVGGIPEIIVESGTGLLVDPGDPGALASALLALLEDPAKARAFGSAGRARVEHELNWDGVVARMAPGLEAASRAPA